MPAHRFGLPAASGAEGVPARSVLELGFEMMEAQADYLRARSRGARAQLRIVDLTGEVLRRSALEEEAEACFRTAEMLDAVLAAARKGSAP